eukprot:IDg19409t1
MSHSCFCNLPTQQARLARPLVLGQCLAQSITRKRPTKTIYYPTAHMKRSFPQYASTRAESADNAKASSKYGKRDAKRDAKRDVDDGDDSVAAAPTRIRLMSWNVDMDTEFKHMRTRGVIAQVRETRPDVVMLQEVTSERISETTRVSVLSLLRSSLCPSSTNDEVVEVIDSDSDGVTEVKKSDKAGTTVKKRAVVSDDDDEVIVVSDDPTHEKGSDARQL